MSNNVLNYFTCANYCGYRFAEIERYNNQCKSHKDKIKFLPKKCWDNCINNKKHNLDFKKIHKEKYTCCEK